MDLPTADFKLLHKALVEAVDTTDNLELLSEIALGRPLNEIGPPASHKVLVMRVIKTAESLDRVKELIVEAREINELNVNLRTVADELLPKLNSEIDKPCLPLQKPNGSEAPTTVESIKVLPPTQEFAVPEELVPLIEMPSTSTLDSGGSSWADAAELESRMSHAVRSSNTTLVQTLSREIITRLHTTPDPIPERTAKWLLNVLRRSRLFAQMTELAEAMIGAGLEAPPQIRRQYAQALIDQGCLSAAEAVLQSINNDPHASKWEKFEARGLIGRIYKQRYLDYAVSPLRLNFLSRAINEYGSVYKLDPTNNVWHGINLVALIARARRDNLPLDLPDENALAQEVLATIEQRESEAVEPSPAWDVAVRLEANLALNRYREAAHAASEYIHSFGTDAFEIGSTLRQLTEVWQLDSRQPPGSEILPILQSAYLRRQGASLELNTSVIKEAATVAPVLESVPESIVAADKLVTLNWYQKGLEQCNAIARIEKANGQAHGTGWLVNAADFFPGRSGVLFVTNEHIISKDPDIGSAILPEYARVNFQTIGRVFKIKEVVWSSSREDLDTTFVSLDGEPQVQPLTIHAKPIKATEHAPRVYIIGYPSGRDLELSMQDNHLFFADEKVLQYRASTEPGSGGSPVFEPTNWEVIALHHARRSVAGIKGISELSEGISILAIQKATLAQ